MPCNNNNTAQTFRDTLPFKCCCIAVSGMEKRSHSMSPQEREVVAFHEAGHALVGWMLEHTDPLLKVIIVIIRIRVRVRVRIRKAMKVRIVLLLLIII